MFLNFSVSAMEENQKMVSFFLFDCSHGISFYEVTFYYSLFFVMFYCFNMVVLTFCCLLV